MLSTERQFIEGAARALWVTAWADREENTCRECGAEITDENRDEECETYADGRDHDRLYAHRGCSFSGVELTDIAPETPDYVKLEAARLLGKLETVNRLNVTAIMAAAAQAESAEAPRSCDHNAEGETCKAHEQEQLTDTEQWEFGWCVAMQAMGTGVSWTDNYAKFDLPYPPYSSERQSFKVPHFEFTYWQLED